MKTSGIKTKKQLHFRSWMTMSVLTTCFCFASTASAQPLPTDQTENARPTQDNDIDRQELTSFDRFLDDHREIADRLRKDPSLVDNREFVDNHPDLQAYLRDHPRVREVIKADPNGFMRREERFDHRNDDRDINREELVRFNQFLDSHRETAEQLRRDPSLVDNRQFVKGHPELQAYLQDHPRIREQLEDNPNAFMRADERLDRRQDERDPQELARFNQFLDSHRETAEQLRKDPSLVDNPKFLNGHPELQAYLQDHPRIREQLQNDPNAFMQADARFDRRQDDRDRQELAHFDQFLDNHRETAEQLRRDPALVDNPQFVKGHPELQAYLQDHPGIREELEQNPNILRQQESRFDRRDGAMDRDAMHRQFGEFLGGHSAIAQQLSSDPSLAKNQEFLANHPELQDYLDAHPAARQQLMDDPQSFVNSAQRFNHNTNNDRMPAPSVKTPTVNPTANPKPNQ
jgi:hypothetical protein